MSAQKKTPIRASTQNHLDTSDVQDGFILLKNGSCCLVLQTTAINFGLLSEKEQEATIYAYAGLLNSLTFPLQILIHSRQKDVSSYLFLVDQQLKREKNERIKNQIQNYRQFIETTVQKNKILDKKFYLVISYTPVRKISQEVLLERAKADLYPKKDHLISQFQRLGLKVIQLNSQKIIEILYNIYNPSSEGQKFVSPDEYAAPFVQAAIKSQPLKPAAPKPKTHRPCAAVRQPANFGDARLGKAPNPPQAVPLPASTPNTGPAPSSIPSRDPSRATTSTQPVSTEHRLEGQKLQEKINDIVKKVSHQASIQKK